MNENILKIKNNVELLRQEIINHKVYTEISNLSDLCLFMEYHIYAVWDFMSLLKALQINLTCTTIPWFPVGNPVTRQLINEIVAGEESDIDLNGEIKSHFELYLEAMQQCGADTKPVKQFLSSLQQGKTFNEAYALANVPLEAQKFVNSTFEIINNNQPHLQASSFTFGREDLIPNMFYSIVNDLNSKQPDQVSIFNYYLERHIEVDGDQHSHLALEMVEQLCGDNEKYWTEAESVAKIALQNRIDLWNAAYNKILATKQMD